MFWNRRRGPDTVAIISRVAGQIPARAGVERWLLNNALDYSPKGRHDVPWVHWDRWFDLHTRGHIHKHRPDAWSWYRLQGAERPIYMHRHYDEIPGSVPYPRDAIQEAFAWGGQPQEFFTSSIDWMIALAIHEGFRRIQLFGVDMWEGHERKIQREGAQYWIGQAQGRGVEVEIPDVSSLCKTERVYGWFDLTSSRNFASTSIRRFLLQCHDAEAMTKDGYVSPGIDEGPTPRRNTA